MGLVVLIASATLVVLALESSPTSANESVHLTIAANSAGVYDYSPSSVQVPAGSLVQFTVVNYDPMNHSASWHWCNVTGTVGGMMQGYGGWMGPGMMGGRGMMGGSGALHSLSPSAVSHTFTLVGSGLNVNVPIPAARSPSEPATIVFSVQMPMAGTFTWTCEVLGMGATSAAPGGMQGTLDIE